MTTERLHLMQSSMQHTDTRQEKKADVHETLSKLPDLVGFTELDSQTIDLLAERCDGARYNLFTQGSVGIAVSPLHEIVDVGNVKVLQALKSPTGKGSYRARDILEVTVRTLVGNMVTVHESHWITDAPTQQRADKRETQSEMMAERVRLHSKGRRISFWMGDTNEDEGQPEKEVQRPLTAAGLISIYDALKTYPNTHGKATIDVIGHCKMDGRVHPDAVHVWPQGDKDHRSVSAWYTLRP